MAGRRMLYGGPSAAAAAAGAGGGNTNTILLHNQRVPCSSEPLDSLFLSGSSPSFLAGSSRSMVSFEDVNGGKRRDRSFFHCFDQEDNNNVDEEELDEYFHQPEKKRRLSPDQVQFLEQSFEVDNKLEPERKIQLAKDLGLQPRQIAIWFQNRRARWKTKQLEKDYKALQSSYNGLKADYDGLLKEKEKLKAEVLDLTDKLKQKEKGKSESSDDTNQQSEAPLPRPIADSVSEGEVYKVSSMACKQEDLSSAKSDVLDSDSPRYIDGGHSSLLEPGDSSYVFEPDQSDVSQDEEDNLSKNLLPPPAAYVFPKIEDADYTDSPANSSYFGFPIEDHTFGFWS